MNLETLVKLTFKAFNKCFWAFHLFQDIGLTIIIEVKKPKFFWKMGQILTNLKRGQSQNKKYIILIWKEKIIIMKNKCLSIPKIG